MNKGLKTRSTILDKSRGVFNRLGWDITISKISREIGHGKSQITNHFPKKSDLIHGILELFEEKLTQLLHNSGQLDEDYSFKEHVMVLNDLMDLMYDYRGAIGFSLLAPKKDESMMSYLRKRYSSNRDRLELRVGRMIEQGLLDKGLEAPEEAKIFEIQYMNMLSTWFLTFELYHGKENYNSIKPYYIKASLNIFTPYLTSLGRTNFKAAMEFIESDGFTTNRG